jgi:uncharacterized protein (DUF1330 family)
MAYRQDLLTNQERIGIPIMSVYLIAQIAIHDHEEYRKYIEGFRDIFAKYEGKMLVIDDQVTILEGEWPYNRTVLIHFPGEEEARRWYESPEYQGLAKHRFASSKANIIMAKGRSGG